MAEEVGFYFLLILNHILLKNLGILHFILGSISIEQAIHSASYSPCFTPRFQ